MNYLIDAHFEKVQPELRIINIDSNTIILEFDAETLNELIESGAIYPPDFLNTCDTHTVIKELFLLACGQSLNVEETIDICLHCTHCEQEPNFDLRQFTTYMPATTV